MASLSLKGINKIYPNGFHAVKDFDLESHVINLNPDTIEYMDQSTGTLIVFNSKRNGMPDIKEALETAYATTGITYEQFLEMGADWAPAE